jgi:rhomboid family GlyGly-CTERM serine protease
MFGLLNPPWTRGELLASGGLVALVLLLGLAGEGVRDALAWNRAAIEAGHWWRLLTGHLVHLGAGHLLLDLTGLVLLLLFFRDVFAPRDWLLAGLLGAALVSAGLWFLDPGVRGYVGISGVLHTWLFAGLLLSLRHTPLINGIVLAAMIWRLWTEQQPDYDAAYMQSFIGGSVLVNAHLYGALAALPVTALLWRRSQARQARFRANDRGEAAGKA